MWNDRWNVQDGGQSETAGVRKKGFRTWENFPVVQRRTMSGRIRLVILAAALLTAGFVCGMEFYRRQLMERAQMQEHLAQEVLRFHVLANSDSDEDQQLKIKVRDAVLSYLEAEMPGETSGGESGTRFGEVSDRASDVEFGDVSNGVSRIGTNAVSSENNMDVEQTKAWMRAHVDEIEKIGSEVVAESGYDYPVNVAVTTCYFPDKTYGDVTFPAGNYEALRVEIGAAKGHNWWCVLYPGLCFMDSTNAVVPDEGKEKLKNVLTEEEYSQVTVGTKFKIRWYFLDFLNGDEEE